MDYHYKMNCGQYVLHDGADPIGPVMDEVALAFDCESGTLHKHGSVAMVSKWHETAQAKFRAGGFADMADQLLMIAGRFPLEDLNRCLSTSGFVARLYERLRRGEVQALGYNPETANPVAVD